MSRNNLIALIVAAAFVLTVIGQIRGCACNRTPMAEKKDAFREMREAFEEVEKLKKTVAASDKPAASEKPAPSCDKSAAPALRSSGASSPAGRTEPAKKAKTPEGEVDVSATWTPVMGFLSGFFGESPRAGYTTEKHAHIRVGASGGGTVTILVPPPGMSAEEAKALRAELEGIEKATKDAREALATCERVAREARLSRSPLSEYRERQANRDAQANRDEIARLNRLRAELTGK